MSTTRSAAKKWLIANQPEALSRDSRCSKYHPEKSIWFFTFPISFFDSKVGNLNVLLQHQDNLDQFYYLDVPFSFFLENRGKFDIRSSGHQFDLHISAKDRNWLQCERSAGVSFSEFKR